MIVFILNWVKKIIKILIYLINFKAMKKPKLFETYLNPRTILIFKKLSLK